VSFSEDFLYNDDDRPLLLKCCCDKLSQLLPSTLYLHRTKSPASDCNSTNRERFIISRALSIYNLTNHRSFISDPTFISKRLWDDFRLPPLTERLRFGKSKQSGLVTETKSGGDSPQLVGRDTALGERKKDSLKRLTPVTTPRKRKRKIRNCRHTKSQSISLAKDSTDTNLVQLKRI